MLVLIIAILIMAWPEFSRQNKGQSKSLGTYGGGQLENGYIMPFSGANFRYFSPMSYFMLNNAYTHHRVMHTVLDAYQSCEQSCANTKFLLMECSDRYGGKMMLHNTHQNGLSIDFGVPKVSKGKVVRWTNYLGLMHYQLDFDDLGRLKVVPSIAIDFETMARHILALDDAGKKHGVSIKKVIFKIEMKNAFFATPSGKEVKRRGIYFAQNLPDLINRYHEDHYHIDFKLISTPAG